MELKAKVKGVSEKLNERVDASPAGQQLASPGFPTSAVAPLVVQQHLTRGLVLSIREMIPNKEDNSILHGLDDWQNKVIEKKKRKYFTR